MNKQIKKHEFNKDYEGMVSETYVEPLSWKIASSIFDFFYFRLFRKKANKKIIKELREEIKKTEEIPYVESGAHNDWIKHANRTRKMVLKQDPSFFLRWYPVRNTMNVTNSKFVSTELKYLKKTNRWKSLWKSFIKENFTGGQIPFLCNFKTSGNTVHLSYVLEHFWDKTDKKPSDVDYIFEFGGGYGNLCRLIHKLGFDGKYIIFDFPIFSSLQRFYLKLSGLPVYNIEEIERREKGIFCTGDIEKAVSVLKKTIPENTKRNLFIATWSISESPVYIRERFHEFLPKFDYFMMGYQNEFGEVNNNNYLKEFKNINSKIEWHDWPLKQLPAHNMLIGLKK